MMKIIYVMDPYDGWCYAGSENILRLYMRYRSLMEFEVLPAGMLTGELCCNHHPDNATAALRSLRAIEKETKTPFGEKHKEALRNKEFLMDSEIPSRAIMTVRQLAPEQTLPFVHALLHARFYHGMDLNDTSTYLELCEILDIDKQAFFQIFNTDEIKELTQRGFRVADELAETYPTLLYVDDDMTLKLAEGFTPFDILDLRLDRILKGEATGLDDLQEDD
ncbi:MAG: DsbA family protein [Bacteroidaceae bacterium]|nr:DsbA family protein [Bacteroidaceae bacterium]